MLLSVTKTAELLANLFGCGSTSNISLVTKDACWLGVFTKVIPDSGQIPANAEPDPSTQNYSRVNISSFMNSVYHSYSLDRNTTTADRRIGNTSDINFNAAINPSNPDDDSAAIGWGTIVGFGIWTAQTGGTLVAWGKINADPPINVATKSTLHFLKGRFEVHLTDNGALEAVASL